MLNEAIAFFGFKAKDWSTEIQSILCPEAQQFW
jgi:hypothetical protein